MNADNIEQESKSIGTTSSRIFTLSTLVQAFSRSIVGHTKPIKFAEDDFDLVTEREPFVTAYWSKVSTVFRATWMAKSDAPIGDRVAYLRERRNEQNIALTAIFLQALGEFGYRLGELSGWDPGAVDTFGVVEALSPKLVNYIAQSGDGQYDPAWRDAMMKPAAEGGKYAFNNVADSVTKTFRVLCDKAGIPPEGFVDEKEYTNVE